MRHALDQLHDEVRPAGVGRAGVEHPGDVGVVHQGQGLPLGLEAGDDLPRVHAGLDELQRDQALDRLGLLGHPDGAHAALADLLRSACTGRSPCRGVRVTGSSIGLGQGRPGRLVEGAQSRIGRAAASRRSARSSASPAQARSRKAGHASGAWLSTASRKIALTRSGRSLMELAPRGTRTPSTTNAVFARRFSHDGGKSREKSGRARVRKTLAARRTARRGRNSSAGRRWRWRRPGPSPASSTVRPAK